MTMTRRRSLKCTVVGDGGVGKTAMLMSYVMGSCPRTHNPTIFDHYSVSVSVDQDPITLEMYDTAGEDGYDSLRSLAYTQTDVCVVCFSVVQPSSLQSACDKWLKEIRHYLPHVPVVLVGTQTDLREDTARLSQLLSRGQRPVSTELGEKTARRVGASAYVECSALSQSGLKKVFDSAILAAFGIRVRREGERVHKKKKASNAKPWKCLFTGVASLGHRFTAVKREKDEYLFRTEV